MKVKNILIVSALAASLSMMTLAAEAAEVKIQQIRNATVKVTFDETTFLIDPMFSNPGTYPGFENTYRSYLRNPLTPLPFEIDEVLSGVDAVILTHTHLDHWDDAAQKAIPKDMPLLVQNEADRDLVKSQGFSNVKILNQNDNFDGIALTRTPCRHGSEAMMQDPVVGPSLGSVMGIIFRAPDYPSVYIAADTVFYDAIEKTLKNEQPNVVVLNTGGASLDIENFNDDPEIIMDKEDVLTVHQIVPESKLVTVHMDAINHMTVDRRDLSGYVNNKGIRSSVFIPFDGETLEF